MLSDDPQVTVRREIVRTWTRNKTTRNATRAKVGNGNARVVSYTRVKRPRGSLLLRAFVFSHAPRSTTIEQTKALLVVLQNIAVNSAVNRCGFILYSTDRVLVLLGKSCRADKSFARGE